MPHEKPYIDRDYRNESRKAVIKRKLSDRHKRQICNAYLRKMLDCLVLCNDCKQLCNEFKRWEGIDDA